MEMTTAAVLHHPTPASKSVGIGTTSVVTMCNNTNTMCNNTNLSNNSCAASPAPAPHVPQPEYYNLMPTNSVSKRHQMRSRDSSRWSLNQQEIQPMMMDEMMVDEYGNEIHHYPSYRPQHSMDLSDAPLPPPPPQTMPLATCGGTDALCMMGSCPQDSLDSSMMIDRGSNNFQQQQKRLNRQYSSSVEALD